MELINRLAARGALVRRPSDEDRREVLVELTEYGEELLKRLSVVHWEELQTSGPALTEALQAVITDRTYQKAASQANGAVSQ